MFSQRNRLKRELRELDRQIEDLEARKGELDQAAYVGKSANLFLRRGVLVRQIAAMDADENRRKGIRKYPIENNGL